jgi:hypothetical protein
LVLQAMSVGNVVRIHSHDPARGALLDGCIECCGNTTARVFHYAAALAKEFFAEVVDGVRIF